VRYARLEKRYGAQLQDSSGDRMVHVTKSEGKEVKRNGKGNKYSEKIGAVKSPVCNHMFSLCNI
jgi:hypothetical protein